MGAKSLNRWMSIKKVQPGKTALVRGRAKPVDQGLRNVKESKAIAVGKRGWQDVEGEYHRRGCGGTSIASQALKAAESLMRALSSCDQGLPGCRWWWL
jgi:hypothetical protein